MSTKNAIDIIKKRIEKNPVLKEAYFEEEKNYHIACKIREHRKAAGITQKKLAQLIGTKQSVISRMENAEYKGHSLSILRKIATALNRELEDFLLVKNDNYQTIPVHTPFIMHKAASFQNWSPNQIMVTRSYA